jgi:hypothetical protein
MNYNGPISRRLKTLLANYLAQRFVLREIEDAFDGPFDTTADWWWRES